MSMEWEDEEEWRAANYLTKSDEWLLLNSLTQIEGFNSFKVYNGQNLNLGELPGPERVIEFTTKKVEDTDNFDNSLQGYRNAYLDGVVLDQGDYIGFMRTDPKIRLNINVYPNLAAVVGVGLEIERNPEAAEEHYNDFTTKGVVVGYKFD